MSHLGRLIFALSLMVLSETQFLFDHNRKTCEFSNDSKNLQFPAGVFYNFTSANARFLVSPCARIGDDMRRVSIIKNNLTSINGGNNFELVTDPENNDLTILKSIYGDRCDDTSTYSVLFYFDCNKDLMPSPTLISHNDCEYKFRVPNPRCTSVKCGVNLDGHMLSLIAFQNISLEFPYKERLFYASLCGPAKNCNDDSVAACEVKDGKLHQIIGDVATQHISFNKHGFSVQMHTGSTKRNRITLEILLKCNWRATYSNLVVKNVGSKYKFEMETASACIKTPLICAAKKDNIVINLNALSRKDNWHISNDKFFNINVCDRLNVSGHCADSHAQVCLEKDGSQLNYGSILTRFEVNDDYTTISSTFSDGDICPENRSRTLYTDITFKCSKEEKGPVIVKKDDCSYTLEWETPWSCPNEVIVGQNCYVVDRISYRNFSNMHSSVQKYEISPEAYITYSFCRALPSCKGFTNVSACLHLKNKEEIVLGWFSTEIKSVNGMLSMTLQGERCSKYYSDNRTLEVKLLCNHHAEISGTYIKVDVYGSMCHFKMKLFTPLACASQETYPCNITVNGSTFDLSPLSMTNTSYMIRDKENDLEYAINICRPIITSNLMICPMNTAVCLKNLSEPNALERFISIGTAGKLVLQNNVVTMQYDLGRSLMRKIPRTIINFKCGADRGRPKLKDSNPDMITFEWESKYVCPLLEPSYTTVNCLVIDSKTHKKYLLENIEVTHFTFLTRDNSSVLHFDLCSLEYLIKQENGVATSHKLNISIQDDGGKVNKLYLTYSLENKCEPDKYFNTLVIVLNCGTYNNDYTHTDKDFCTYIISLSTKSVCGITPLENSALSEVEKTLLPSGSDQIKTVLPTAKIEHELEPKVIKQNSRSSQVHNGTLLQPDKKLNEETKISPEDQKQTKTFDATGTIIGSVAAVIFIVATSVVLYAFRSKICSRKDYNQIDRELNHFTKNE